MPVFKCSKCGMMENTATSHYWTRDFDRTAGGAKNPSPPLCSLCDPEIGKWHDRFPREPVPPDHVEGPDGFIHHKDDEYLKRLLKEQEEEKKKNDPQRPV